MTEPATRSELGQILEEVRGMRADMKAMQTQLYQNSPQCSVYTAKRLGGGVGRRPCEAAAGNQREQSLNLRLLLDILS